MDILLNYIMKDNIYELEIVNYAMEFKNDFI